MPLRLSMCILTNFIFSSINKARSWTRCVDTESGHLLVTSGPIPYPRISFKNAVYQ